LTFKKREREREMTSMHQESLRQRKAVQTDLAKEEEVTEMTQEDVQKKYFSLPKGTWRQGSLWVALALTLLSLFTRLYRIADADYVVW
jgi:hypothetical protein